MDVSAIFVYLFFAFSFVSGQVLADLELKNILFIVLSQTDDFHLEEAQNFEKHFASQISSLDKDEQPLLLFTHKDFINVRGGWTILPLIEHFVSIKQEVPLSWIFICEGDTRVNVTALLSLLSGFDATQDYFLGRELRDEETTIIHHFAFADNPKQFSYPDFRAGFVLSFSLVYELYSRLHTTKQRTDFSIDPKHELAMFIWNEGSGKRLSHISQFCSSAESDQLECVTTQSMLFPQCATPVHKDDLVVAVKTCGQFHQTRVPVVQKTWGKGVQLIEYFSDVEDASIPTIDLGVPNTERGHCGKTLAIIQRAANHPDIAAARWLLIADDDTIINLDRLRLLLSCYNPNRPVALGERYGYGLLRGGGYDYITGGGGMVFSLRTVRLLAERCRCSSDDAPDDMTLGMCMKAIGIPITHSRYFHQARPNDYSPAFLENQLPVSFHKHWNTDPIKVYADLMAGEKRTNIQNESDGEEMTSLHQEDKGEEKNSHTTRKVEL